MIHELSLERLKAILDSVPIAIVYVDSQERFTYWNRFYETNHGRSVKLGARIIDVLGEEQYRLVKPFMRRAFSGESASFELTVPKSDGSLVYAKATFVPDFDETGKVRGVVTISEDVTSQKLTELELHRSEETLIFALESARLGTWEFDLKSESVSCSPAMLKLWGLDPKEFRGDRSALQSKVHPEDVAVMRESIEIAIARRGIYECEYRILPNPGEERWVSSRGRCTFDENTNQPGKFAGVVFDVTEQRRAREVAEKAVKARDNMISISAHELLTPISGIKLHLQNLIRKLEKGDDVSRDALVKIASQTDQSLNRLTKLVSDMLDISRINLGKLTLKRECVNLSQVIEAAIERSSPMMETAGCTAEVLIRPETRAFVDPYRIEQVLTNLISNACRYAYGKPMQIKLEERNGAAYLSVRDQGIGIRKEDQLRIFERFERATTLNEKTGLGLGLFLVKQIVEAHQGRVSVESEFGKGSNFTVEIPLEAD